MRVRKGVPLGLVFARSIAHSTRSTWLEIVVRHDTERDTPRAFPAGSLLDGRESILSRSQRWQCCAPGPCPHVQRWLSAKSDRRYVCPRSNLVALAASRISNEIRRRLENRRAETRAAERSGSARTIS